MLSAALEAAIVKHVLGVAALAETVTVYLALYTTTPTMPANTGGVEVSGGAYARQAIAFTVSGSNPAVGANSALVQFAAATAAWGTINGAGLFDALTGGNLIDAGALAVAKAIGIGDIFAMPAGNYTCSLT